MLVLMTICLLGTPQNCREERLSFSFDEANYIGCMVHAQQALAEWQHGHPNWRVDRWRCVARNAVPKDI